MSSVLAKGKKHYSLLRYCPFSGVVSGLGRQFSHTLRIKSHMTLIVLDVWKMFFINNKSDIMLFVSFYQHDGCLLLFTLVYIIKLIKAT